MRRIEAEELALARAREVARQRARTRLSAYAYRREVRAALRPRPGWWPVRWALPFVPLALVVVLWAQPDPAPLTDDALGGIRTSDLLERCQAGFRAGPSEELRFPSPREAAAQVSSSADGKRWEGFYTQPDGTRREFTCSYTAADGSLRAEALGEEP